MTAIPIPIPTFLTFHVDKTSGELCPFIQRNQMRVEVGRYESDVALPYQYSLAKCGYWYDTDIVRKKIFIYVSVKIVYQPIWERQIQSRHN